MLTQYHNNQKEFMEEEKKEGQFATVLLAEREGYEPISLCRFNSTLYQHVNALGGTI